MKVSISIDYFLLVKLTHPFAILGYSLEICGSTLTVPQTRVAARQHTWRLKPFHNVAFQSPVFSHSKVYRTRIR